MNNTGQFFSNRMRSEDAGTSKLRNMVDDATFRHIASQEFDLIPQIRSEPATYTGSRIPLHGNASLAGSEESLELTLIDDNAWATAMLMSEPSGMIDLTAGGLFRETFPGRPWATRRKRL